MSDHDIVAMARAASHDERLADGMLYRKLADEITTMAALLTEVASCGIEHSARDYVVLQLPRVTWDAIETWVAAHPEAAQKGGA